MKYILILLLVTCVHLSVGVNPVFPGWYADPEGVVYGFTYWIFPTYSASWGEQTFFDAFSSEDLVTWLKHPRILSTNEVSWARGAMWAPAALEKDGKYYFFFSANDAKQGDIGGIGVAISNNPDGPYLDAIGEPLVTNVHNGANPIDQYVFRDIDGQYYMFYGGGGHCNMVKLDSNLTSLVPFDDGTIYKEVTPEGYVEGPFMFYRNGTYYFMWSEGAWTGPNYKVAYSMSSTPFGPFVRKDTILEQDLDVATGAGHHSVMKVINSDRYVIVYHRRPLNETEEDHRVTCIDEMRFNEDGTIIPVKITFEGVQA